MFKLTYNVKPAWSGTDATGNPIQSSSSNKVGAKMEVTSKTALIEALGTIDLQQLKTAASLALRELDDSETCGGLKKHYTITITIQQPRIEEEVTINGGSRLDNNLIDEEDEESEED